jgi:hypothetical protein
MSHENISVAPTLRMPRQSAGIDRTAGATAAGTDGGVEPAIPLGAVLPLLLSLPPVQDALGGVIDIVGNAVSSVGDFFSGLFS